MLNAHTVTVASATNMSYAMDSLVKAFKKKYPNTSIRVIFGSSGKLTAQIKNGAPYDIFLSADTSYPNELFKSNFAISKPKIYAKGELALFSLKRRDFSNGLNILKSESIKKIALANPKTAPYGRASIEALKNSKIYKGIEKKLIFAEGVSQAVVYSVTATDMGIIPKSALFSPKMKRFKEDKNWISINPKLYNPISQGAVLLKYGAKNKESVNFYNFLFSNRAREIFKNYGYKTQ